MLSEKQELYFKDSKVRDSHGKLLKVYHGTGTKIEAFEPIFTGQGIDQYGSGFYFSTDYSYAYGYMTKELRNNAGDYLPKPGGEDCPNVLEVYVNIENPIHIHEDNPDNRNLRCVEVNRDEAFEIIKRHPDFYLPPSCEEKMNPLGDYLDEFWEMNFESEVDYIPLIEKVVDMCYKHTDLFKLDIVFKDYPTEFREAVRDVLGYDGVIVDFEDSQHIIAWFPEQIKDVRNLEPKKSKYLMDNKDNCFEKRKDILTDGIKNRITRAKIKKETSSTLNKKIKSQYIFK
jgi:hypothetical protein